MTKLAAALAAVLASLVALAIVVSAALADINDAPTDTASTEIPTFLLRAYTNAAQTCPGLPWEVLAAIGWTESRHAEGRADPTTGNVRPPIVGPPLNGQNGTARIPDPSEPDSWAHAHGNMQFLKTTWATWRRVAPGRPPGARPDYDNAFDSIYSAAAYLCGGARRINDLNAAILRYDPSSAYVNTVLTKAAEYGLGQPAPSGGASGASGASGAGGAAVAVAMRELGVPYVYGGESPQTGFDCSGLVQWAYAQVGVHIPRVTLDQVRVGAPVSIDDLQPGDLIFTRGDVPVRDFGHVAMYVGNGIEINAPHTGALVSLRHIDPLQIQAIRRP